MNLRIVHNADDRANSAPLHSGGGGGTFDDMEARVKRLEDDAKDYRADLKAIRIDLGKIEGKISNMPSTWQVVGINAALLGLVIASAGGLLAILRSLPPPA